MGHTFCSIFCFFGTERKQNVFKFGRKGDNEFVPYSASLEIERKQNAFEVGRKGEIDVVPYSTSLELRENRMPLRSAVKGRLM